MKVVLQIVDEASVKVDNKIIGQIGKGYLLLVGIFQGDTDNNVIKMAEKISKLRIFEDENGKTNLSLATVNGSILSVSQFTLCALLDSRRPSFSYAASADVAKMLYHKFNEYLSEYGIIVKEGVFGEEMDVRLLNKGPFTIVVTENDL